MRILWIGPNYRHRYNAGHEHLADAMARIHDVVRYGHAMPDSGAHACYLWGEGAIVPALVEHFEEIELVVVQHPRHCMEYSGFEEVTVPKACLVTDYFPRNHETKNAFLSRGFDMAFFPERYMVEQAKAFQTTGKLPRSLMVRWLPFAVDTDIFRPLPLMKRYDAMALFSGDQRGSYPHREDVVSEVSRLRGRKTFAHIVYNDTGKVTHEDYVRLINQSRIAVTSNDRWGSTNLKHLEYLACGTVMLSDRAHDFDAMGIAPSRHYVEYSNLKDIHRIIGETLDTPPLMRDLRDAGIALVRERHSTRQRADELTEILEKEL